MNLNLSWICNSWFLFYGYIGFFKYRYYFNKSWSIASKREPRNVKNASAKKEGEGVKEGEGLEEGGGGGRRGTLPDE